MATIARIIVSESELQNKRQLFADFIAESKKLLPKGKKHQFILLPGGFLKFSINDPADTSIAEPQEKTAKQKWYAKVESLKEQALTEFHHSLDSEMLRKLKSVAHYLVIGIDSDAALESKDLRIQLVLVYDLQAERPLHWTGKSYPQRIEKDYLVRMPIDTHFIKQKIDGKKVAIFGCHDLSIFNQRHQRYFSPFADEREKRKRKENTATGKIKCPFIDATLDFSPEIMLQLPHTEGPWAAKWTQLDKWLRKKNKGKALQHFATGLKRNPKEQIQHSLSGTQRGDVVNFASGKWID
jgi:hypothetical protein